MKVECQNVIKEENHEGSYGTNEVKTDAIFSSFLLSFLFFLIFYSFFVSTEPAAHRINRVPVY